jgi:beta-galactosidase
MEILFGVDYYPEHWPKERWETDAKLMRDMGIDVVRMGEFSWGKMEPKKGLFNFGWLDDVITLLAAQGIKTILGTPTAAPPAWIIAETPEIQPVDSQNRQRFFGGRHHDCQSNTIYREHIRRFVTAYAKHFAGNLDVIGWQIDNELGNSHEDLCMCPSCEASFREWLKLKYDDIDTLNNAWGTAFWGQQYQNFSEIQAPKLTVTGHNPSQMLDWKRFCSDLIVDFFCFQEDILQYNSPGKFITHNMMGFADKVNYFELSRHMSFSSQDQYPAGFFRAEQNATKCASRMAAELDFIRGTKQKSFWVMEQQAGITGWEYMGRAPKPGQLGLWAMQSIAHGADTICFFRWRTRSMGPEQFWHGILPHSGMPGRYFNEIKAFITKAKPLLSEIQGTVPKSRVGIVFSYDQLYALDIQPQHPDLDYISQLMKYYTAFYKRNVPVDFISDDAEFSQYDLIIAPLQFILRRQLEIRYRNYVRNGGTLLMTMRTGVKTASNLCQTESPLPGGLRDVLGIEVRDYDCLRDTVNYVTWYNIRYACEKWCDIITLIGARTLANYSDEFYSGTPAITVNSFGRGAAYYVGTEPSTELASSIAEELIIECHLRSFGDTPDGVEICHRHGRDRDYIFVINHTGDKKQIQIPANWKAYYKGQSGTLGGYAADVYTLEKGK